MMQIEQLQREIEALPPKVFIRLRQWFADKDGERFASESAAFWSLCTLEEIMQMQATPVVTDIDTLKVDFGPEVESADDFNQSIAERHKADRKQKAAQQEFKGLTF